MCRRLVVAVVVFCLTGFVPLEKIRMVSEIGGGCRVLSLDPKTYWVFEKEVPVLQKSRGRRAH